jgi:hypothetical protein
MPFRSGHESHVPCWEKEGLLPGFEPSRAIKTGHHEGPKSPVPPRKSLGIGVIGERRLLGVVWRAPLNGVALVVDFTSTEWWQHLTEHSDFILFVRPKIQFLPKSDGRMNCLGSTLVAIGEAGIQALRTAERNGRGICFRRDSGIRQRHPLAATSPKRFHVAAAAE